LAVDVVAAFGPFVEESAVRGLSSRIEPIRRTISGHDMVWISACNIRWLESKVKPKNEGTNIRYTQKVGIKVIHVYQSYYAEDEGNYLPDVKRGEEQEEK
jgi:hypothetical protein